jgi:RNA polymerase sigma-70 factor (ECF subfamily)
MPPPLQSHDLVSAAPEGVRRRLAQGLADGLVEEICRRVGAAHPDLELGPSFLAFVGARLNEGVLDRGLDSLFVEDLALVWACLEASPTALERFDLTVLRPILRRLGTDADTAQRVREKLWVGRKLEEYAGRGALSAWTRMVVRRQVINDARGSGPSTVPESEEAGGEAALLALADPELLALQADARATLEQALRDALAGLAAEDRELLRLHHIEGIPHGEVGKRVGLPRSTVAFRLERARERLLKEVRESLARLLGERQSDVDSLIRAVRGDFDLSLSLLRREES